MLFSLIILGLFMWSVVWAYGDAERRGKSGCLVALLVFLLSWPIGLIVWLVFRPYELPRFARRSENSYRAFSDNPFPGAPTHATIVLRCDNCGGFLVNVDDQLICPTCSPHRTSSS